MKREAFDALPPMMQLKVLSRIALDGERLEDIEVGKKPFPPKFDTRIRRANSSFQWASETDAAGLAYFRKRAIDSASKGGQWASRDAKHAKELERWMAWREWEPRTVWRGERFNVKAVAAPPADKPEIHQYERRQESSDSAPVDDEEVKYSEDGDDDSPYG